MSYEKKLLEMKGLLKKNVPEKQPKKEVPEIALPFYTEQWKQAGLKLIKNEKGFFFLKETFYRKKHIHGTIGLDKLEEAISFMQERYPNHPLTVSPGNPFCFYDTETTGLKGTGVLIFLNGILKKAPGGYLLSQYVLVEPGQEAAFLLATEFWKDTQTIITYNGKSFDIPQLNTRWTMNRNNLPPLKEHEQIDLMHSSKRIWKGDLERFKLKQLEESKLGFTRKNDLPGHLAPIIYFDAVKQGDPTNLMRILKHNEWDILSLATLYTLSIDLLKKEESLETANTYTNIGKWFKDLKSKDASNKWFEFVVDQFSESETSVAYFYIGLHLKRQNLIEESVEAFEIALKEIDGKYRLKVLVELAKLYEHQKKDYQKALEKTQECLDYWSKTRMDSPKGFEGELLKREIRIKRKIDISRESAQPNKKRT
ncbi:MULTISPECIES: ribonuclease H-like domain-containing protein [unclassified Psychrobacillus]|uniref:ribonuclease H-like domain-containing protein n=1 Tax=unclassified Psychrobacillus TaxID=2636677 RepID=UPI00146C640C|nr:MULTISPECIES: ribonuclease H-like domain-containing protein [unclassified Psychrobacillus]MCM3359098.1 ribonuclease H-like domain-containing protein [Psychrobacillus sp. MER TA 171]NME05810.1 exonuclease [Psychrobacillus sp. BL-248-WT-3]